jgi:DNA-binding PadR family transcriptional regulator
MPTNMIIGEFEQLVLLAVLQLGDDAYAIDIRDKLSTIAGRTISRGALYRTLDRLAEKGLVGWDLEEDQIPERGGHPRRRFDATAEGIAALKVSRATLQGLWAGLEEVLR